jgi:diacylglycerol kinase family enzyme
VFVNNVSLGLYAQAVQEEGYREAKIRTILATVSDVTGPQADPPSLRWQGKDGPESGVALLVSNNQYRIGRAMSAGTRPRMDEALLGMTVFAPGDRLTMRQWTAPTFEVQADEPVPAGVDGEALTFDPPLIFKSKPQALRVRIARQHPGASPSSELPDTPWGAIAKLARMALTRSG